MEGPAYCCLKRLCSPWLLLFLLRWMFHNARGTGCQYFVVASIFWMSRSGCYTSWTQHFVNVLKEISPYVCTDCYFHLMNTPNLSSPFHAVKINADWKGLCISRTNAWNLSLHISGFAEGKTFLLKLKVDWRLHGWQRINGVLSIEMNSWKSLNWQGLNRFTTL